MSSPIEPRQLFGPGAEWVPLQRPLPRPAYDTEVYNKNSQIIHLTFLQRALSQSMLGTVDHVKTLADTSLLRAGKFEADRSLLGIGITLPENLSDDDREQILSGGLLTLEIQEEAHSKTLVKFQIPLPLLVKFDASKDRLKSILDRYEQWREMARPILAENELTKKFLSDHRLNTHEYFSLAIGDKNCYKIREKYHYTRCWIDWNTPPQPTRPVRIMVSFPGFSWEPL